jgi:hypothetical protein
MNRKSWKRPEKFINFKKIILNQQRMSFHCRIPKKNNNKKLMHAEMK